MFPTFRQTPTQRRDCSTIDSRIDDRLYRDTQQGDANAVRHLLERGVDSNGVSKEGTTALHIAARQGHLDVVKLLIKHGAEVNKLSNRNVTREQSGSALLFAAQEGHSAVVAFLLEEGADVEARFEGCATALAMAIAQCHNDIVCLLLDHGASHLVRPEDYLTALHRAANAMNDDTEIIRLLITRGADLDALDDEQRSPLQLAAQCGNLEIVRLLLDSGANANLDNGAFGPKPLRSAASNGHFQVVQLLLDRGADVGAVESDARLTALHRAARMGELDITQLLLERGANVNAAAQDGSTPLHHAVTGGYKDIVSLLLDWGAAIEATARGEDYSGTPLHCTLTSYAKGSPEVLRVLLERGADFQALNIDGLSVVQIARMRTDGGVKMLNVLHQHMLGTSMGPLNNVGQEHVRILHTLSNPGAYDSEELFNDNKHLCDQDDLMDWMWALDQGPPPYISRAITDPQWPILSSYANWNLIIKKKELRILLTERTDSAYESIGLLHLVRYEHISHSPFDLECAMRAFRESRFCVSLVQDRFNAARLYADLCLHYRDAASAMRPFKIAMKLLQQVIDPGQSLSERYRLIPSVRDTVDAAVAVAIQNDDIVLALEWFEQGRCMIWGHLCRLRPPVEEIRDHSPKLAEDMETIIKDMSALEALIEGPIFNPGREGAINRHQELSTRYEAMVTEAQGILGLGGYMKPKSMDELKNAAIHSNVVALNVAWWRCDALIIKHQSLDVVHVPLPKVSPEVLQRLFVDFQQALKSADLCARSVIQGQWDDEGSLEHVLSELWVCVVEPVLTALGCMEIPSDGDLPRITWCASGLLAFLPLHAAGPYHVSSHDSSALDLAIHSYVPSITSLLNATHVRHPAEPGVPTILAISQPATPRRVPIPSTVTEVKAIQHVAGSQGLTWLNDSVATTSAVLARMEEHAWVHLACHAVQDPLEPLQSAFLLHDGGITLRSIMRLRFDRGKALAVLSACQTATGDSKVPDEAVHLAAGMFMGGFQNVVGTMWSINDKDAPVFASAFYSYLINEASGDSGRTAQALHHAVRELRDQVGERNFLKWVPFIHVGI